MFGETVLHPGLRLETSDLNNAHCPTQWLCCFLKRRFRQACASERRHYQLNWVWKLGWCLVPYQCALCEWVRGSDSLWAHHTLTCNWDRATCTILIFFKNFCLSVSSLSTFLPTNPLSLSQGERGVWPRRGESSAYRLACCSRYLLWELQDDPGLEIRKCPWLIRCTAALAPSKVRGF